MLTVGAIFSSCSTDTWRLGSVMIRSGGGGYRFQIDIGGANKADIAVVEIDAGELGAGSR